MCAEEVELRVIASEAWNTLAKANLLGQLLWEIRSRDIVGVLGALAANQEKRVL